MLFRSDLRRKSPFRVVGLNVPGAPFGQLRVVDLGDPSVVVNVELGVSVSRALESAVPVSLRVAPSALTLGVATAVPAAGTASPWLDRIAQEVAGELALHPWGLDLSCLCDPDEEPLWLARGGV